MSSCFQCCSIYEALFTGMQAIVWLPLPDNSTLKQNIGAYIYVVWKELCSSQFAARSLTFCIVSLHHKVRHFKSAVSNFFSLFKISSLSLPLPPKKLIGNMEREFIAERQKGLQAYLDVITSHHLLSNCELVKKFLDPNSYSVNYTGKWGTVKVHYSFTAVCVCVSSAVLVGIYTEACCSRGRGERPSQPSYIITRTV